MLSITWITSLIGSMEDLTAASLDDVAQFFATFYTPDNAVLSIAGDFDPAEARRLVERHFGPIPKGSGKPPLPPMDVPPDFGAPRRARDQRRKIIAIAASASAPAWPMADFWIVMHWSPVRMF